jgi:Ca-activated chloride channel family protein
MADHALDLSLALDVRGIAAGAPREAHLVAEITARAAGIELSRPPLSVVFAIDASGSMKGPPIEQVAQSIERLVGLLEPTDRAGVVAFSDEAAEITPLLPCDAEAKRLIAARSRRIQADGWTHVESGLRRAASLLPPRALHERQVILLLSDGAPNRGITAPEALAALARSFRPDVAVSTLGYGAQHHEDVLTAISEAGSGRYHFIADPAVCSFEFAQAIGAQGDVVAEAIELSLLPAIGVEIGRVLGNPRVSFGASGLKLAIPDLLDGDRHAVVASIKLPPRRETGPFEVLRASLTYRRAGEREPRLVVLPLSIEVGLPEDGARLTRAVVLRAKADEARAAARALADRGHFEGAAALLRAIIRLIEAEPGLVRNDGSPLAEALEQLVDEAVAMERKPAMEQYGTFRKSMTQISMTTPSLRSSPVTGPMSMRALSSVAQVLPTATLTVVAGGEVGTRFVLDSPKVMIGRTPAAQIQIADANVSRNHAMIVGQEGHFFVMDLGSTNTTSVNGAPLAAPHRLQLGDVIRVGDVELRYHEERRRP